MQPLLVDILPSKGLYMPSALRLVFAGEGTDARWFVPHSAWSLSGLGAVLLLRRSASLRGVEHARYPPKFLNK